MPANVCWRRETSTVRTVLSFVAIGTLTLLGFSGCSGLVSSNSTPPPSSLAISASSLPNGQVGTAYSATLAASGGKAPYTWSVATGSSLPSWLSLNASAGQLSGMPTQSGTVSFTIQVTDSSATPQTASKAFSFSVAAASNPVSITTSSLANGQVGTAYSATLAASGGTAPYTWSVATGSSLPSWLSLNASSGQLNGTPTQSGTVSFTIQVTDSSATPQTASKPFSFSVAATGPIPVSITTTSLPNGIAGTPYSATLTATGGTTPYTWSVTSGTLPSGLTLSASTGQITGTPTQTGTYPITAQVKDSTGATATSSGLAVTIDTASACGGPLTYCSRTDVTTVQLPAALPNVGNLIGANTIVTDPDFSNRIVRVTDANTDNNASFAVGNGGSADVNEFNADSTMLVLEEGSSGTKFLFGFDPSTMQISQPYGKATVGTGIWSASNKLVYYQLGSNRLQIQKLDFSTTTPPNMPTPVTIADFTACLGYSNPNFTVLGGVSQDDSVFTAAYSPTGGQGSPGDIVMWKVGSGCRRLNTTTGNITGDWGPTGPMTDSHIGWGIHNVKQGFGSDWMVITTTGCSGCTGNLFWNLSTLTVTEASSSTGGHWIAGWEHWVNNDNGGMHELIRPYASPAAYTEIVTVFPPTIPSSGIDQHQSWNNNHDSTDSMPFFTTTFGTVLPYPSAWQNEVMGVSMAGTVWRFCHTFNSSQSTQFSTTDTIGTVSQDGKWYMWSSDWMGALGSLSGSSTCTLGSNCRGDVFIVELR